VVGSRIVKTIQVRNVSDETHRVLRTRAAAAGMSLSDLAREELDRAAERPSVAEVLLRARRRTGGPTTEQIVAAVRAGRERDD